MPATAAAAARNVAASDPRIRLIENPKGPRHGEVYRHAALQHARGSVICYLGDDDYMLPNHVESMLRLLGTADLAHSLPLNVEPDGTVTSWACDLQIGWYRRLLLSGENRISLSFLAHTLDAYRRLPHGWRTTPAGTPTDLYMLQQFLAEPWVRPVSGTVATALHIGSAGRKQHTQQQRVDELATWAARMSAPCAQLEATQLALTGMAHFAATAEAHYRYEHELATRAA